MSMTTASPTSSPLSSIAPVRPPRNPDGSRLSSVASSIRLLKAFSEEQVEIGISDLAKRVIRHIEHCCSTSAGARIAMVTHAEVIRTAVLHYLGMPFSAFSRIEIEPASISKIVFADNGPVLTGLNETVAA